MIFEYSSTLTAYFDKNIVEHIGQSHFKPVRTSLVQAHNLFPLMVTFVSQSVYCTAYTQVTKNNTMNPVTISSLDLPLSWYQDLLLIQ